MVYFVGVVYYGVIGDWKLWAVGHVKGGSILSNEDNYSDLSTTLGCEYGLHDFDYTMYVLRYVLRLVLWNVSA